MMVYFMGSNGQTPEELQAEIERHEMMMQDRVHRVESFVYDQDQDGLIALSLFMHMLGDSKRNMAYWTGIVDGVLKDRHNVCPVHGVNHDEELLKDSETKQDDDAEPATEVEREELLAADPWRDVLAQYHLRHDEDTDTFFCTLCGYKYPSIADRMLKGPDECPGCEIKAAHG